MPRRKLVISEGRVMRRAIAALAGVAMLVSIAVMASPSGATPPSTETITLVRVPHGNPVSWSASGTVFSDHGSWTEERFICGGCPSPVEFAGQFFDTAMGQNSADTIKLRFVLASNAVTIKEQDLCFIVGGTGAYAKLRGQGTFTIVDDGPNIDVVCTAQMHNETT